MEYTVVVSRGPFSGIQAAAFAEESIDWWDDSQSEAQTACTVCFAAAELAKYLPGEVTLREPEDTVPAENGTVILLGTAGDAFLSAALRQLGLSQTLSMKKEGFRMAGCRRGDTDYVILAGADRAGAMYAAFSYLERLGIHFIEPGEPCVTEVCPQPDFDISEAPSYTGRGTMSTFINASEEFLLWMAHNRFNSGFFRKANHHFALRKKLCIDSVVGGHQMFYLFADTTQEYPYKHAIYGGEGKPADPYPVSPLCRAPSGEGGVMTYGDAHPEWYALVDGKHRMKRDRARFLRAGNAPGDNMCTSNQDAVTELCRLIVDALADGVWKYADHVHIWPLDNGIWCQCPQCQKLGNYSARILNLAYQVDKAIKTAYTHGRLKRKILLICPAYHETLPVPDKALPEDFDYDHDDYSQYEVENLNFFDLNGNLVESISVMDHLKEYDIEGIIYINGVEKMDGELRVDFMTYDMTSGDQTTYRCTVDTDTFELSAPETAGDYDFVDRMSEDGNEESAAVLGSYTIRKFWMYLLKKWLLMQKKTHL